MLHELLVRMLGIGMAGLIQFQPPVLTYRGDSLRVAVSLPNPITNEIKEASRGGYGFAVDYSISIIINDRKSYRALRTNRMEYDGSWKVNGKAMVEDSLASRMGTAETSFPRVRFEAGDKLLLLVTAAIAPDSAFARSTGLPTSILWNYLLPRSATSWAFDPAAEGFSPL